ncbi:MAG: tyrosine-type recombinase/integrase [Acidimicrobiales bacterium]
MNGEGGLYKRSDGRWFGAVLVGYDGTGRPRRKTVSARTKDEARRKLSDLQRQIDTGYIPPTRRETVAQLLSRWDSDVLSTQVKPLARENYRAVAERHIVPTLGRTQVSNLTVADVQHLLAAKLVGTLEGSRPLSVSTVRRIRSVLAQALNECVVEGTLSRNVAALTKPPKSERAEGRTLTPDQARALLAAMDDHRLGALFALMLSTGLRRGEALGLRWADIDLSRGIVVVRRQLQRVSGELVTNDVKTSKSRRAVNVAPPVVKLLEAHKVAQAKDRLACRDAWQETEYVFTTQLGTPLDPRNIHRDFQTICIKAGVGKWHPHELRHSAASLMLSAGVPLQVVSDVLGHSSIRMTADVYGHILQPQREDAASALAGVLFG